MNSKVYLALGANIGDREGYLKRAVQEISLIRDSKLDAVSKIYETEPVGYIDQPKFLNMTVSVFTSLTPIDLLRQLQTIENHLGRLKDIHWGPRTIDIDILLFGSVEVHLPELDIPHPRMFERAFVLVPLRDIINEGKIDGTDIDELLNKCSDKTGVKLYEVPEIQI